MLDTRHFDRDFTDRLLAALSDAGSLDEQLDGLLVHGENFQTLNLLQDAVSMSRWIVSILIRLLIRMRHPILYKNGYQGSSTWVSLIESSASRFSPRDCLSNQWHFSCCAIDDEQQKELGFRALLQTVFNKEITVLTILVRTNSNSGRTNTKSDTL